MNDATPQLNEDDFYEHLNLVIDGKQEPLRIDKFLINRLQNTSRNRVQMAAAAGCLLVNGQAVKSNYKVRPGDNVQLIFPSRQTPIELDPEDIPLTIVYEDDSLLVVNKSAGMVVHPGVGNHSGTLVNALLHYMGGSDLPSTESIRPGLVHRIDKNTSGLLVVAKTESAMQHLAKQFFDHTVHRRYKALVWGEFEDEASTITGNIMRHPRYRQMYTVSKSEDLGKHAVTHFKVLESMGYVSLVECRLETGRTHQIRVHMKHLGHPIFSDEVYGGDKILKGTIYSKYKQFVQNCFTMMPRQALHAASLGFVHPESGEEMYFEAEYPEDFDSVLKKWQSYAVQLKGK